MKKFLSHFRSKAGFSLIEVLVAATVFMVGFSLLVALTNSTAQKFSVQELAVATQLAKEAMEQSIAQYDSVGQAKIVTSLGLEFGIEHDIQISGRLVRNHLVVERPRSHRKVVELYGEYLLP